MRGEEEMRVGTKKQGYGTWKRRGVLYVRGVGGQNRSKVFQRKNK